MHRLLIVDDEPIITNSLYEVFKNIEMLELDVYKAYSGEEALEILYSAKIDIVLTDVRMPGLSGLELLDHIYSRWPFCKVIMLTGFDEFDYIYKAIQYKGVNYLLKTEGYDKVIQTVRSAVDEIDKSMKVENLLEKAKQQMLLTNELLQKEYFQLLLKSYIPFNDINNTQFNKLGISLRAEYDTILVLGRYDSLPKDVSYSEKSEYIYSLKLLANKYFSELTENLCIVDNNSDFIWVLQPKKISFKSDEYLEYDSEIDRITIFVKGMIEVIQEACKKSLNLSISFASCSKPVKWEDIPGKFVILKQLLDFKIGQGTEMLLFDKQIDLGLKKQNIAGRQNDLIKNTDILGSYLERGKREEFFLMLKEMARVFLGVKSMHDGLAIEIYYSISLMILSYINRFGLRENISFKIGLGGLTNLANNSTWENAEEYLKEVSNIIFEIQADDQKKRGTYVISVIYNYIDTHISEDISLVKLAEQVYFNPSYLSRLFKQVTGENLSEYIFNAKIKKAKKMLEMQNIKIHEISEELGYGTAQNFTRFFKKGTNMTPQEYRDSIK